MVALIEHLSVLEDTEEGLSFFVYFLEGKMDFLRDYLVDGGAIEPRIEYLLCDFFDAILGQWQT